MPLKPAASCSLARPPSAVRSVRRGFQSPYPPPTLHLPAAQTLRFLLQRLLACMVSSSNWCALPAVTDDQPDPKGRGGEPRPSVVRECTRWGEVESVDGWMRARPREARRDNHTATDAMSTHRAHSEYKSSTHASRTYFLLDNGRWTIRYKTPPHTVRYRSGREAAGTSHP